MSTSIDFLSNLRLADALDVVVVAILIYCLLIWFRERASRSLTIVVVSLVAIYLLSRWLEMYLTTMFFELGFIGLMLAFVVIFQDDLRRGFEGLAMPRWFGGKPVSRRDPRIVDTLAESISLLASQSIGALLVFPGREPLDRHLQGGVPLDAHISLPLLCSIFHSESPGHDGAVVISGQRIERLGVHLPLSSKLHEVAGGGTRHAAALGLVERTDALVVVVSEERGTISIASDGRLESADSAVLIHKLEQWYEHHGLNAPVRSSQMASHNVGLKFSALLIACALWFVFAYQNETIQRTVVVPIEYRNLAASLTVDDPGFTHAELSLSGSEQAFRSLDVRSVSVSFDLSEVRVERTVTLQTDGSLKNVPSELELNQIRPREVTVNVRLRPPAPQAAAKGP